MKGISRGCVTAVNAIPCGIGATIGTDLKTEAWFSLSGEGRTVRILNEPDEDDALARVCVRAAFSSAGVPEPENWTLETVSEMPPSRGLKSGSSAANAVISAVSGEMGFGFGRERIVLLGVDCARAAGVTVTGSFDDAFGCEFGGICKTDNSKDRVLEHAGIGEYDIVIHVPPAKTRKNTLPLEELRSARDAFLKIAEKALDDPFGAMTENGAMIAKIQNIDDSVSKKAISMGALGAGITGSGPASAAVVAKGDGPSFARDLGIPREETIVTRTRDRG